KKVLFFMFLFFVSMIISATLKSDMDQLILSIAYFILSLVLNIFIPSLFRENTYKLIVNSYLIIHIPIVTIPFLIEGLGSSTYHGGFMNANSMGITATVMLAVLVSIIVNKLENSFISKNSQI